MWQGHSNILADVRAELKSMITEAVSDAREKGLINLTDIPEFYIQQPDQREYGDLSTSLPLMMARDAKMAPRQIADIIVRCMRESELIQQYMQEQLLEALTKTQYSPVKYLE